MWVGEITEPKKTKNCYSPIPPDSVVLNTFDDVNFSDFSNKILKFVSTKR